MKTALSLILSLSVISFAQEPRKDTGEFIEKKSGFWHEIKDSMDTYYEEEDAPDLRFKMNLTDVDIPQDTSEFTKYWHNPPVSQGMTGTCWCFSGTSFLESEIYRLTGKDIKISEMYTVYWETVEKARRYVQERGDSQFSQGSELNAVTRIWKMYGVVPLSTYPGKVDEQPFHDHGDMWSEMRSYLEEVKVSNAWNEELVLQTIRSIMDHYLGVPPEYVKSHGAKLTPKQYLKRILRIDVEDYVDVMSLMEKPYGEFTEYDVADNWWNSEDYLNLPLSDFMSVAKHAIRNGFTLGIGGDVSEAGLRSWEEVAVVPTFDIPAEYIDENARQFRFSNRSTTDDHGIHLIGYSVRNGEDWYLIKDSGAGGHTGQTKGYSYYHEDYVKLKMMTYIVHKDAVQGYIPK